MFGKHKKEKKPSKCKVEAGKESMKATSTKSCATRGETKNSTKDSNK